MHGVQFDTEYTEKLKLSRIYIGLNYSKAEYYNIHTTIAFQNLKINIVHDFDIYIK